MGSESVKSSKYAFEDVFESTSGIIDAFLNEAVSADSDLAVSTISESPFDSFFFSDFDFLDEKFFDNAAVEEANLAARPLSTVYRLDSETLANFCTHLIPSWLVQAEIKCMSTDRIPGRICIN